MYKRNLIAIAAVLCSILFTYGSSAVIFHNFKNLPYADDLFFKLVPYSAVAQYFADGAVVLGVSISLFLSVRYPKYANKVIFSYAVMWTVRAILNMLTPLGDPSGDQMTYGFLETIPLLGMFPSGHIASIMLGFWWAMRLNQRRLGYLALLLAVIETFALWSSRGHYTIDIVGGVALSYFAVLWVNMIEQKWFPIANKTSSLIT